ncbi:MAG TPA: LysE family transporter [Cytophagaceae bacterium]|jgi:threonine/homoserine/homoserine lactone efflux protein|nr:LysE family transporter [Cytophagaceae bacterium]
MNSIMSLLFHFSIGFITSFIGSLPLGAINAAVVRISFTQNIAAALKFIVGATLAELLYSFIAVYFSAFLLLVPKFDIIIQLISIPIFMIMGVSYFRSKNKGKAIPAESSGSYKKEFLQGLSIGLLNPLQIPFWLAYSTYFISIGWLSNDKLLLSVFILGIIAGSSILLFLIAKFASYYKDRFHLNDKIINQITGGVFLLLAFYQTGKILFTTFE